VRRHHFVKQEPTSSSLSLSLSSDPLSPPRKKCKDALWTLVTGWKHPNATMATHFASFLYICQSPLFGSVLKKRTKRLSCKALWSTPQPTWLHHRRQTVCTYVRVHPQLSLSPRTVPPIPRCSTMPKSMACTTR